MQLESAQIELIQPWWETVLEVGAWLSAIAVAVYAKRQIDREKARDEERQRAAEARISALGYMLRRQLRSWLGIEPEERRKVEGWLDTARRQESYSKEIDRAEGLVMDMLTAADNASESVSSQVQRMAIYFLNGANLLNQFAATDRPTTSGRAVVQWVQLVRDAETELRECLNSLESKIITGRLLEEEAAIASQREMGKKSVRMAEIIERHGHLDEFSV